MIALDKMFAKSIEAAKVRPLRKLRDWACQEIIIPDGPYKGERFKIERQPFAGLLFDEVDSGRWPEVFVCGPSQTGKTLIGHVIPTIYVAAEWRRNLVFALPDMRMANDKWEIDFRPVLQASPTLAALIPTSGPGSRGGSIKNAVCLTNGATLKWMTAGGDDVQRAGFTAEGGVFVTEAARFSTSGEASVEADPLDQLRARMQSLPRKKRRLIVEGTATIEAELPWSARSQSSQSRIVLPCPKCGRWVQLEREQLQGWQQARSEHEAAESAYYACPDCGERWSEEERAAANRAAKLLHGEQSIDEHGDVVGDLPPTERLWFRWTMGNNLLLSAGDVAVDEWKAAQLVEDSPERENAERKLCQFVWGRPFVPKSLDDAPLTANRVQRRQDALPIGLAPEDTLYLTIGVDLGKWYGHYVVVAWRPGGLSHIVAYGIFDVPTRNPDREDGFDENVALGKALDKLRDEFETIGFTRQGSGEVLLPDKVLADDGYLSEVVKQFARRVSSDGQFGRASEAYVCCRGIGTGQHRKRKYLHPSRRGSTVLKIGEQYFVSRQAADRCHVVEVHANYWKSWVHGRLQAPAGQPGSMTLFSAPEKHHNTFAKHLTNECSTVVDGLRTWENKSRKPNHYFDALVYACVAGHMAGWRLFEEPPLSPAASVPLAEASLVTPDGRDFYSMPHGD